MNKKHQISQWGPRRIADLHALEIARSSSGPLGRQRTIRELRVKAHLTEFIHDASVEMCENKSLLLQTNTSLLIPPDFFLATERQWEQRRGTGQRKLPSALELITELLAENLGSDVSCRKKKKTKLQISGKLWICRNSELQRLEMWAGWAGRHSGESFWGS